MLNELQKDGLTEIVNMGIGQGAHLLSEMTGRKVELSVPYLDLLAPREIDASVLARIAVPNGHIISSSLKFDSEFKGKAFLLFPASKAKVLVSLCLGEPAPNTSFSQRELLDTDFDVLKEVGNVILNCVIGGLGNFLKCKLTYSLPEVEMLFVSPEDQKTLLQGQMHVLVLHTCFKLADTQLHGTIMIVLSMDSISQLIARIDQFLEDPDESVL